MSPQQRASRVGFELLFERDRGRLHFKFVRDLELRSPAEVGAFDAGVRPSIFRTNAVAVPPSNANVIYVGTDIGAWVTSDAGATWKHIGKANGLPYAPVFHIDIDACGITMFTFGRGVFRNGVPCS